MAHIHTQLGVDHNPCYTPTKIGAVTGVSGSMEIAAVRSINAVLYAAVFQIICMIIQGKEKYL